MIGSVRRHPVVTAVMVTYLVAIGAYGLVNGSRLAIPYVVIVAVAFVGLAVADDRFRFTRIVLVGLTLWGMGHLAGGIVELDGGDRILYNVVVQRWFHFDNVVHFIGFGTAGLALWEALRAKWLAGVEVGPVATVVFVALLGCGVGAVNEVLEFAYTLAVPDSQVGGFQNTGRDLVANLLGGLTAGVYSGAAAPVTAAPRELVAALVGEWTGVYRLWLEPGVLRIESATRCTGRPVVGGRFVALDYHWTDLDGPQEGTILLGGTDAGGWDMALVDTWHTASSIMSFTGAGPDADVFGQYGPPEERWGWRTRIELVSPDELVITAWNVTPSGEEHKATEAVYRR